MNKKNWILLLTFFSIIEISFGQSAGPYIPLSFTNTNIEWNHVPIDSSMIDYEDSISRQFGFSYDGYNHFIFENQNLPPLIDSGYMYVLSTTFINFDAGGYFVEKIDLTTGELIWKVGLDLRTTNVREHPRLARVVGDRLIIFLYRDFSPEPNPSALPFPILLSGFINTKLVRVEFDINSGLLLDEFIANESDFDNQLFQSGNNMLHLNEEQNNLKYFQKELGYTVRTTTTNEGRFLYEDTLKNIISDLDWENIDFEDPIFNKILSYEDEIYLLDVFIPNDSLTSSEAQFVLSKYDEDDNLIFSNSILESVKDSIGQLFLHSISATHIYLKGFRYRQIDWQPFFIILDHNGEFVKFIDANPNGLNKIKTTLACTPRQVEQDFLVFTTDYNEFTRKSRINVYVQENNSALALKKQLHFDGENYAFHIVGAWYLDNGDVLFHLVHRFHDIAEDRFLSYINNWIRFTPEELRGETVSTKEITYNNLSLYPNPSNDRLNISTINISTNGGDIFIYDVFGKLIYVESYDSNELNIDLSSWADGTYNCKVVDKETGNIFSGRFIKTN